jgi:hypothetical protein
MPKWFVWGTLIAICAGCSAVPQRVKPPRIDPGRAAQQAIELYDANHDGKLSKEELASCPGISISLERYDLNHDKAVDEEEIRNHLTELLGGRVGATQLGCNVSYKGTPLSGAKVVFEPEPYLGIDIQTAEGITNNYGLAEVGMPPEKAPAALRRMKLIQYGTYKVRVTHASINIPAKYNTETTLGYETIPGQPSVSFALK